MVSLALLVLLLGALGAAAVRWGVDTRDGRDWQPLHEPVAAHWFPARAGSRTMTRAGEPQVLPSEDPTGTRFLHWCSRAAEPRLHGEILPPQREWVRPAPPRRCCPHIDASGRS